MASDVDKGSNRAQQRLRQPTWYASEAAVAAASRRALGTLGPSLCITTALAMAPITERQLAPTRRFDTKVRTRNLVSCSLHHH